MDPKILKIIRAMLGLDSKLLPDSMNPEDFGKFIDDQKGKLFGNPEDFKKLQKIISSKDVDFQKTKKRLEELKLELKKPNNGKEETELEKKVLELSKQLLETTNALTKINEAETIKKLEKEYPDILPELLTGKTEEQITAVVEKQRAKNKKLYGDSKLYTQPTYTDVADVDKEIEVVKADKTMSSEKQAVRILQLGRTREEVSNSSLDSE